MMSRVDRWTLVAEERHWRELTDHLFPGDHDEHGAVLLAGIASGREGLRLLVRDVLLARDDRDYVPGERGYRALAPSFIAGAVRRARDEGWAYLAAHNHGGSDSVAFSSVDLASHERGYPALQQISGKPVGGLVLATQAVAGDLWLVDGSRAALDSARILGRNIRSLSPRRSQSTDAAAELFDRQARLFGAAGQRRMSSMRVAVVGLGGAGSMAAEMLVRVGVGELVLIDPDRVESSNVPRVVGSSTSDVAPTLRRRRFPWRRSAAASMLKVDIAERAARFTGMATRVQTLPVNVSHPDAVSALSLCDWIVLAADSHEARNLVNAVVHGFLIPAVQVGVKVPVDPASGVVGEVFAVARRVLPSSGCLWCNGLIDPTELQLEVTGEEGRRARAYVGADAPAPSVITLNGLAVSHALTDLMLASNGLLADPDHEAPEAAFARFLPRSNRFYMDEPRRDRNCAFCGDHAESLRAKGREARLPVPLVTEPDPPRRGRSSSLPWRRETP